jgi:hypothetical protein
LNSVKKQGNKIDLTETYNKHNMANLGLRDGKKATVLMRAVTNQNNDVNSKDVVQAIVSEIQAHNNSLKTKIDAVKLDTKLSVLEAKKIEEGLTQQIINFSETDEQGRNVFHLTCAFGKVSTLEMLLKYARENLATAEIQAIFNQKDRSGYTPLMLAARHEREDVINELFPDTYHNGSKIGNPYHLKLDETHEACGFTPVDFLIYQRKLLNMQINQALDAQKQEQHAKCDRAERRLKAAGGVSAMEQTKNQNENLVSLIEKGAISPPACPSCSPSSLSMPGTMFYPAPAAAGVVTAPTPRLSNALVL